MEHLIGESLAERLERDPRLPIPLACSITRQCATALQVAHDGGIVHRDLKPGNIFLVTDAESPVGVRAKVLDFGIAKLTRDRDQRTARTVSGTLIGTPRYMSPEQCKNARDVDGRSDIYSLGCLLYEMLLGVAPFDYDTWAELVGAHLHETPPRPTELDKTLPAVVDELVVKMLEKKADNRFASMQELAQALDGLLRDQTGSTDPTLMAPTPTGEKLPAPAKKKRAPWLAIGIAGGVVIAGAITAFVVLRHESNDVQKPEPTFVVVDHQADHNTGSGSPAPVEPARTTSPPPDAAVVAVKTVEKPLSQTEQLARTFGKQTSALATCFKANPGVHDDLSVRIQIDAAGRVVSAEILPDNTTPLAQCLAGVAKKTAFGVQPKAATFRIPIHTNEN